MFASLALSQLAHAAQVAAAHHLREVTRKEVTGRAKLGVAAFAEALLGVPKTLAENSGYDAQVRRCSSSSNLVAKCEGVLTLRCAGAALQQLQQLSV